MIRELGHFTALSAIIVYLNAGIDSSPTDTLGNKGPDNLATSFAERLIGVLPEGIEIGDSRIIGRNRLKNGHVPEGIDPARLNTIDLLYPETR